MRGACRCLPLVRGMRACPVVQYLPARAVIPVSAVWRSAAAQRERRGEGPRLEDPQEARASRRWTPAAWRERQGEGRPQLPSLDSPHVGAHSQRIRSAALEQRRFMSIDKYSLFGGEEAGEQRTSVDSYNKHGFMVNGVLIQGAVILLPETTLLWDVTKMEDINSDSLVALRLLRTKPELCIVGTGRRMQRTPKSLHDDLKAMGIAYDVMDTVNALATFNVLNEEGRNVVGAFLPLDPVDVQQSFGESLSIAASSDPRDSTQQGKE